MGVHIKEKQKDQNICIVNPSKSLQDGIMENETEGQKKIEKNCRQTKFQSN